jgi:5-formyltetrahydrofolate cyclo-ligase
MLYNALPDEVPTQALMDQLVAQGKTVLLPCVINDTDMELRRYTDPQDLQPGSFGIQEPTGELFTDYDTIDVAIVPGMAFDAEGHRLGRGKGYYDRFLCQHLDVKRIGICFDFQLVDEVPTEPLDIKMDEVITL